MQRGVRVAQAVADAFRGEQLVDGFLPTLIPHFLKKAACITTRRHKTRFGKCVSTDSDRACRDLPPARPDTPPASATVWSASRRSCPNAAGPLPRPASWE